MWMGVIVNQDSRIYSYNKVNKKRFLLLRVGFSEKKVFSLMVSDHDLALKKGLAWTPVLSQFIEGRKSLENYICSQTLLYQGFFSYL